MIRALRPTRSIATAMFGVIFLAGCYTLQPVGGVPPVGDRIAFDINDAGRVALGGSMGPEISQIEGRLIQRDTGVYLVDVSTVRFLRGGEQPWSGEVVHIKSDYVSSSYDRRFSPGRTIILSAAAAVAVATLAARSLIGSGSVDQPGTITSDSGKTQRIPPRLHLPKRSIGLHPSPRFLPTLSRP